MLWLVPDRGVPKPFYAGEGGRVRKTTHFPNVPIVVSKLPVINFLLTFDTNQFSSKNVKKFNFV